jgi:ketol-acid reductoisomerase
MSLLQDFTDNTQIFDGYHKKIDQAAFDKLIETQGEDVARGYLKCLHELAQVMDNIIHDPPEANKYSYRQSKTFVTAKAIHLYNALHDFAEKNSLKTDHLSEPRPPSSRMQIF